MGIVEQVDSSLKERAENQENSGSMELEIAYNYFIL